jgi:hypothetical protein
VREGRAVDRHRIALPRSERRLVFSDKWAYAPAPEANNYIKIRPRYSLFINGEFVSPRSGKYFDSINPATEEKLAEIAQANARDVDRAVISARRAHNRIWGKMPPRERAKYLYRIARLIQEKSRELAVLESMDGGKTIRESRDIDLPLVAAHFFYYAGWADKLEYAFPGRTARPLGVAGQIIPWNFPLLMAAWKLAPALAAGNTCVLKPAETTSITAMHLAEIFQAAELPDGVVNIVTGAGETGKTLVDHPVRPFGTGLVETITGWTTQAFDANALLWGLIGGGALGLVMFLLSAPSRRLARLPMALVGFTAFGLLTALALDESVWPALGWGTLLICVGGGALALRMRLATPPAPLGLQWRRQAPRDGERGQRGDQEGAEEPRGRESSHRARIATRQARRVRDDAGERGAHRDGESRRRQCGSQAVRVAAVPSQPISSCSSVMSTRRSLWLSLECSSAVRPTSDDHAASRAARLSNHSSAIPSHGSRPSWLVDPVTRHTRYFRRPGNTFA